MNYPPSVLMQVPLRVGLDNSIDPAHAQPGTLTNVVNGVWNKIGRIEKRNGNQVADWTSPFTMIDGGAVPGPLKKILPSRTELSVTDGISLFSKSATGWRNAGRISELEAKWNDIVATNDSIQYFDVDANANYVAVAWTAGSSVVYAAIQGTDGSLVVPPTVVDVGPGFYPRIFVDANGTATIFYATAANLLARTLSASGLSGSTTIIAGTTNTYFDAVRNAVASGYVIASYEAGPALKLRAVTTGLVAGAATTVVASNLDRVAICSCAEAVYVAYVNNTTPRINLAVHNASTLAQIAGPTIIRAIASGSSLGVSVVRRDATSCVVAWQEGNGSTIHTWSLAVTIGAATVANSERRSFFTAPASRLFVLNSRIYIGLYTIRPPILVGGAAVRQPSFYVAEVETSSNSGQPSTPHRLTAMIAPREAGFIATDVPGVAVVGNVAYLLAPITGEPGTSYTGSVNTLRLTTLNAAPIDPCPTDNLRDLHLLGGGYLASYANRYAFETSFIQPPRVVSSTPAAGIMAAGTYQYCFVYEWTGADGLLYRSAPSQPVSVTLGANQQTTFVLECTGPTGRANLQTGFANNPSPVRIVPYRTTVGGSTFYRMSFGASGGGGFNVVLNDPLSATVNWADNRTDGSFDGLSTPLNTRPILYTTGGVLDEVMPPAFYALTVHRGRIWGVAGDGRTIWFSKKFTDDTSTFPGFNEVLRISVADRVVALRSMDDKLVIFTDRAIYVLYGDGPASTGQGSDFAEPTLVHGNMPCITPNSVVSFPGGIVFQSNHGLQILTRALEVQWFGQQVQDEIPIQLSRLVGTSTNVVCATHHEQKSHLRFSLGLQIPEGDYKRVVLVYDYAHGLWSRFDYGTYAGIDGVNLGGIVSERVINNVLYSASSSVTYLLTQENTGYKDDLADGSVGWVSLDFEFTLTPSGPIAWQHMRRIQLRGVYSSAHQLRVRFAFNPDNAFLYQQDFQFTDAQTLVNKGSPTIRVSSQNGANPKAKSIRVRVTDAAPASLITGPGSAFNAVALEFVPKPGLPRHGANNSKV